MNKLYLIKALTNMHPGSGEVNYNIVDNQVQRDVITDRPIINSSSFKGCLRDYLSGKMSDSQIGYIFGDTKGNIGKYTFFNCNLLSLPVRSNKKSFFRAVCKETIEELVSTINNFSIHIDISILRELIDLASEKEKGFDYFIIFENYDDLEDISIEGYKCEHQQFEKVKQLESVLGENIVLTSNEVFNELTKELPVIARNHLEERKSQNLWYEEVVPRESIFYTTIKIEDNEESEDFDKQHGYIDEFNKNITGNNVIQIGANASIGYGYSRIVELCSFAGDKNE